MVRRKTHEEFTEEVHTLTNGEYEVLGQYINTKTKIKLKNIKTNKVINITPNSFLGNYDTNSKKGKTHTQFVQDVYDLVGDEYTVISEYKKARIKVQMRHNTCGNEWGVTPNNFLREFQCPVCGDEKSASKLRWTQDKYEEEVFKKTNGEYEVVGEYVNARERIDMKHVVCGFVFPITPDHFLGKNATKCPCPKCQNKSSGEYLIKKELNKHDIEYTPQFRFEDCKYKNSLPFDFAILDKSNNVEYIIEYDGEQHFKPIDFAGKGEEWAKEQFEINKTRDGIKNDYCREKGIRLIRIPYWEINNIEEILHSIIYNKPIEVDETSFLFVSFKVGVK